MRTLDHSLTQGRSQWGLLLSHPYLRTATPPSADSGACSRVGMDFQEAAVWGGCGATPAS